MQIDAPVHRLAITVDDGNIVGVKVEPAAAKTSPFAAGIESRQRVPRTVLPRRNLADRVVLERIIPEREDCPRRFPPSHQLLQGFLNGADDGFFRLAAGSLESVPDPAFDTVTLVGNVVSQDSRDHKHEHE